MRPSLLLVLLWGCAKGSSPGASVPGSETETGAASVVDTDAEGPGEDLRIDFVGMEEGRSVDECSTNCFSVQVTDDDGPMEGVSVDFWLETTVVEMDVRTSAGGRAEGCADGLPVGTGRLLAVAHFDGGTVEAETSISVESFGFADGIHRASGGGLPYTPFFSRAAENPVFSPGATGSFDSVGVLLPSVVRTEDGWVMWYAGTADVDYAVGVASSDDGLQWIRRGSAIFPADGLTASWKRHATNAPMIVADGEGWRVYYAGRAEDSRDITIGMAMGLEPDVVVDYPGNPVFEWSESEVSWAGQAVAHPAILRHPDGHWEMWYSTGLHKLGYAYSMDGLDWKRWCRNAVMTGETGDSWESHQLKAADVILHDGWYLMAYTGGVRGSFRIGWAMSRDGLNWTRATDPVLRPALEPGTWESSAVTGPSLWADGGTLRMWYGGSGLTGSAIGLATASLPASLDGVP